MGTSTERYQRKKKLRKNQEERKRKVNVQLENKSEKLTTWNSTL